MCELSTVHLDAFFRGGNLGFMRVFLLFALTCRFALAAPDVAPTEVPKSRSPDGKFALYYEPFLNRASGSPEFTVYFRSADLARASAQLDPNFGNNYPGKPGASWKLDELNNWDTQSLLDMICRCNEFHLRKELFDSGFFYNVTWTPDSHWVVIEGGAHKFWHLAAYHLENGEFRQIDLFTLHSQIDSYFATHLRASRIEEDGIEKGVMAKWGNHESHYVVWLRDGYFAVLGYPFLLQNADFNRQRARGEIYFLVDCCDPREAKVVGMAH